MGSKNRSYSKKYNVLKSAFFLHVKTMINNGVVNSLLFETIQWFENALFLHVNMMINHRVENSLLFEKIQCFEIRFFPPRKNDDQQWGRKFAPI